MSVMDRVSRRADPTYDRTKIRANPVWELAFVMSEIEYDAAPMGWGNYLSLAEGIMANFEVTPKEWRK
jgi:hypothetical protein